MNLQFESKQPASLPPASATPSSSSLSSPPPFSSFSLNQPAAGPVLDSPLEPLPPVALQHMMSSDLASARNPNLDTNKPNTRTSAARPGPVETASAQPVPLGQTWGEGDWAHERVKKARSLSGMSYNMSELGEEEEEDPEILRLSKLLVLRVVKDMWLSLNGVTTGEIHVRLVLKHTPKFLRKYYMPLSAAIVPLPSPTPLPALPKHTLKSTNLSEHVISASWKTMPKNVDSLDQVPKPTTLAAPLSGASTNLGGAGDQGRQPLSNSQVKESVQVIRALAAGV